MDFLTRLRRRVASGAKFLDKHAPTWWKRIDLKTLDLNNCVACVLGQTFGGYEEAVIEFHLADTTKPYWFFDNDCQKKAIALGFQLAPDEEGEYGPDGPSEYDLLGDEWKRVILARREQEASPCNSLSYWTNTASTTDAPENLPTSLQDGLESSAPGAGLEPASTASGYEGSVLLVGNAAPI